MFERVVRERNASATETVEGGARVVEGPVPDEEGKGVEAREVVRERVNVRDTARRIGLTAREKGVDDREPVEAGAWMGDAAEPSSGLKANGFLIVLCAARRTTRSTV